jgi:hypothetical protein
LPISATWRYRQDVAIEPIIAESARRHGVSDEDMLHAYAQPIRVFELDNGFTMVIGSNHAAIILKSASWTESQPRSSCTP